MREQLWCSTCHARREVIDSDTDVVTEGSISTSYEIEWHWSALSCGHQETRPTGNTYHH